MNTEKICAEAFEKLFPFSHFGARDSDYDEQSGKKEGFHAAFNLLMPLIQKQNEALKFYANVKRLMLEIDKLPTQDPFGFPLAYTSKSLADNGDTARSTLKQVEDELKSLGDTSLRSEKIGGGQ